MELLSDLWVIFQFVVGYNLVLPIILFLWWRFSRRSASPEIGGVPGDYAIIVTAFRQTDLLPAVVNSILKLNNPNYLIYVVADDCDVSSLEFSDPRVVLLRPPTLLASNTRSHFYAIDRFERAHNRLLIIDSDNILESTLLDELDRYFASGYVAVQGVRKAKNLDSTIACLDAARDMYYHFYDGKVLFELGSSATLAGSGMAFTVELYKECLGQMDITGAGFDKVLQAEILKRNLRIAFNEKAIVFDEKTSQSTQLVNQRARWINTWFKYFTFGFQIFGLGLRNASKNQLLMGVVLLRPPLFMFIIISGLCMFIGVFTSLLAVTLWAVAFLLFFIGFYIALRYSNADSRIFNSLQGIPKFILYQLISLVKSKRANENSIATIHYHKDHPEQQ